ncbi:MAG TPA: serine/threonine protein kinase, partial [Galbitalea sp.]|nr:serine/threonine protein kinase [Galbitalea sp.]
VVRQTGGPGSSTAKPVQSTRVRALVWGLIVVGVLALALGTTAIFVLVNANGDIPVVSNIAASTSGNSIKFTWQNPGLGPQDQYQISTSDSDSSVQQANSFVVDGTKGEHVCITVTVNRQGKLGSASSPKCVDVGG